MLMSQMVPITQFSPADRNDFGDLRGLLALIDEEVVPFDDGLHRLLKAMTAQPCRRDIRR